MSAAKTHDYTVRYWGHDYIFRPIDGGQEANAQGWGTGICDGDFLVLPNGAETSRYYVESISYYSNPSDMWKAHLIFAPRPTTQTGGRG